jgi:hypothetical protein
MSYGDHLGRRALAGVGTALAVAAFARPAAAHTGTTHAGTPHWLLLVVTLGGAVAAVGGWAAIQDDETSTRFGTALVVAGVLAAIFGSIGLVEIQVAPQDTPDWTRWFPVINAVAAMVVALGTFAVGFLRYPERPRYVALGFLLSAWIAYPVVMPNEGLSHPLGYLLAFAVPVAVGYVLYRDAGNALPAALSGRVPKLVGAGALGLFAVFFAFSAGTMTVNPDLAAGVPDGGFVTDYRVASPLVYWPAVEFYLPAIPLAGYVSLGTVLLVVLLGGLVALNAALAARQFRADGGAESPRAMLGAVTASGATACCCCAPALYGAVGVLFGTAASPVYWAFMDPTSPVGGLFFAASVLLLTGSAIRASSSPACQISPSGQSDATGVAGD